MNYRNSDLQAFTAAGEPRLPQKHDNPKPLRRFFK